MTILIIALCISLIVIVVLGVNSYLYHRRPKPDVPVEVTNEIGKMQTSNTRLVGEVARYEGALAEREREIRDLKQHNVGLSQSLSEAKQQLALKIQENNAALERMTIEAEHQIRQYQAKLNLEFEEKKRSDRQASNQRSRGALTAKIAEHMSPILPGFPYNPKDCRHWGEIFDFIVLDGLEEGEIREIVFLEIKTSTTGRTRRVTNPREKMLRDAIKRGKVTYAVWQPQLGGEDATTE